MAPLGAGPAAARAARPDGVQCWPPPAGLRAEPALLLLGRDRLCLVDRLVAPGELRASGGEPLTQLGVLWTPPRPHCIEIMLGLVDLLGGQLADLLFEALQS